MEPRSFDEWRNLMAISTLEAQQAKIVKLQDEIAAKFSAELAELVTKLSTVIALNEQNRKWHADNVQRAREQNRSA